MESYKKRLHHVIPGGAHTYSRGDDQFPSNAPTILESGDGAWVKDPSGKKYLDYGMGLRSVNIGYGNKEIADACYAEIVKGNNLTRASIVELEAAELLASMIPCIDMVKFAKHGSVVTTAAIKLSRAYTGRKYICVPVEQPFFSYDDWFIGSTVMNKGVPAEFAELTLKFNYNNIASLQVLFDKYPNQIAAVMLEPASTTHPCNDCPNCTTLICADCPNNKSNFLHQVKNICKKHGAVFILDEMITGFRWHINGAQTYYDIEPDLTTFGKAMANGFAVAALGGKREIMELGSILNEGHERVFLTSTTHGAEMSALGAFIKTIEILKRENVVQHFWDYGTKLMNYTNSLAKELNIENHFEMMGIPCSPNYITKDLDANISLAYRTLFAQEMIKHGVMMPYLALSYAHQQVEFEFTKNAIAESLLVYKKALEGNINEYLHSPIIKPVFRKYN
jgi:glutamate-1-semialdehyde 2,1-aminomutase